jgi:hypothetical protein
MRGRPRCSNRLRADDCAVLDVRSLPHVPSPSLPERIARTLREAFPDAPKRHDLTLTLPNGAQMKLTLFTTTTRPFYGGARRWFVCPSCGRRCAKLYTPNSNERPFACRACGGLVYDSQYDRDERFKLIRRLILRPKSETASARRQRDRRWRKKFEAMSEAQLLALLEASLVRR